MALQQVLSDPVLRLLIMLFFIAKGLHPILFNPEKIYYSFGKRCQLDKRIKTSTNAQWSGVERRTCQSTPRPRFLPLIEYEKQLVIHTIGYCFCFAFSVQTIQTIQTIMEILTKYLHK